MMIEMALGIEPRTSLRIIFSSPYQSQGEESDSNRRQQFLDRSSPLRLALGYLRNRFDQTANLNLQRHLYAGVVSFHSEASTNTVDAKLPDSRSGGAGVGGSDHNKGEGESDDHKRKMAISMSQKFTLGYAALLGVGGVMGYLKGGSQKSLLAGGLSASLLYYVYTELPERPAFASSVGLGISGALCGVMGARYKRTGKVFPAGVVSLVSLVMTGGYLHGIWRSMN